MRLHARVLSVPMLLLALVSAHGAWAGPPTEQLRDGVDRVFKFDVQSMPRSPEDGRLEEKPGAEDAINGHASWGEFTPQVIEGAPVWEESGLEQKTEAMAAAV